jgi:hypothetical protein
MAWAPLHTMQRGKGRRALQPVLELFQLRSSVRTVIWGSVPSVDTVTAPHVGQ